ncbi:MAG: glycosyltransferase [FCB group bacterium]|nr:glycosyltransferase [FCB group bacterium]
MEPGEVIKIYSVYNPQISVIIPSFYAPGSILDLIDDLKEQTERSIEIILVYQVRPSGRARNLGAEKALGEFFVFMDDDIRLGDENVLRNLIEPLKNDKSIGLTGASIRIPLDANRFQRIAARQTPRLEFPILAEMQDSDMVTTQCWAQTRECFEKIGPFTEIIDRGVDPEYRRRVREKGLRTVITPNTWSYHPPPENLWSFIKQNYRNGKFSAHAQRKHPHLVVPVPDSGEISEITKTSLLYRIMRAVITVFASLFNLRIMQFIERLSYGAGYIIGRLDKSHL